MRMLGRWREGSWALRLILVWIVALNGCGVGYLFYPVMRRAPGDPRNLPAALVKRPDFLMGVATSAYQIEGGNIYSDWHHAEETGAIQVAERCGDAVDGWNRVPGDIQLIRSIGANAYRFSIEWSRLEPTAGHFDEAAFQHYADEVAQLRAAGITPMVTLLHFTLPEWLAERGGVLAPDFPELFAAFAHEAARRLGNQVTLWCTLNEPNVQNVASYLGGGWPPGRNSREEAAEAFAAMLKAHAAAAAVLHREVPGAQVGMAMAVAYFEPNFWLSPLDWAVTVASAHAFNLAYNDSVAAGRILFHLPGFPALDEPVEGLAGSCDFFGMNYYRRVLMTVDFTSARFVEQMAPKAGAHNDLGWGVYPEGLLPLLREMWGRYKLPIYITENGTADKEGAARAAFLDAHLYAVGLALQEGIPVKGYFHWSLMDNFEWEAGFGPRFGLFRVDRGDNYKRVETAGAVEFRRLAGKILGGRGEDAISPGR
jgi:beta-glucosidase